MAAVRELVQTALENDEDLIVEGDYLPSEWRDELRVAHAAARERFPCRPGLGQL